MFHALQASKPEEAPASRAIPIRRPEEAGKAAEADKPAADGQPAAPDTPPAEAPPSAATAAASEGNAAPSVSTNGPVSGREAQVCQCLLAQECMNQALAVKHC